MQQGWDFPVLLSFWFTSLLSAGNTRVHMDTRIKSERDDGR